MNTPDRYSCLKEQRVDLRSEIPLPKPFTLLFEPACMCNFRCTCCFYNIPNIHQIMPKGLMDWQDFCRIADAFANWEGPKLKVIRIIGFGEPLLNPRTPDMVKYLKEIDLAERIEITSNASLLTAETADRLLDSGLDYFRASIYAVDSEKHRNLTKNPILPEKICAQLAEFKRRRDQRGLQKPFIYAKMIDRGDSQENQAFLSSYRESADEVALEKQHNWLESSAEKTRLVCAQPFKMMSVRFNGDVILCDPDWQNKTCVGNLLKHPPWKIWNGPEMLKFLRMQLEGRRREHPSCRNCSFPNENYVLDDLDRVPVSCLKKAEK